MAFVVRERSEWRITRWQNEKVGPIIDSNRTFLPVVIEFCADDLEVFIEHKGNEWRRCGKAGGVPVVLHDILRSKILPILILVEIFYVCRIYI